MWEIIDIKFAPPRLPAAEIFAPSFLALEDTVAANADCFENCDGFDISTEFLIFVIPGIALWNIFFDVGALTR